MKQIKKMQLKAVLKLTEQDLLNGNKSKNIKENLKADLISVLQFMIDNKDTLKIDLDYYEYENKYGIYRNVAGWWAYWLGIPIKTEGNNLTDRFKKVFIIKANLFKNFNSPCSYYKEELDLFKFFFGTSEYGDLPKRWIRAKTL